MIVKVVRIGCWKWVLEEALLEANMVFNCTSFHGFSYREVQSLFQTEIDEEYDEENDVDDEEENFLIK